MCKDCDELRARIVDLEATVRALRLMVQDLGGMPPETADSMYEDEQPLIVWEGRE